MENWKEEVVALLNKGQYAEADKILDKVNPNWRDVELG